MNRSTISSLLNSITDSDCFIPEQGKDKTVDEIAKVSLYFVSLMFGLSRFFACQKFSSVLLDKENRIKLELPVLHKIMKG